ncbi:hypothetical protein F4802DRAFT_384133 [Xylaria palmicola]|nr:hypothetical protein F4802DRAFT_384133 [Xylaria palmicola]
MTDSFPLSMASKRRFRAASSPACPPSLFLLVFFPPLTYSLILSWSLYTLAVGRPMPSPASDDPCSGDGFRPRIPLPYPGKDVCATLQRQPLGFLIRFHSSQALLDLADGHLDRGNIRPSDALPDTSGYLSL